MNKQHGNFIAIPAHIESRARADHQLLRRLDGKGAGGVGRDAEIGAAIAQIDFAVLVVEIHHQLGVGVQKNAGAVLQSDVLLLADVGLVNFRRRRLHERKRAAGDDRQARCRR